MVDGQHQLHGLWRHRPRQRRRRLLLRVRDCVRWLCATSSLLTLHGLVSRHVHNYERFYPEYNGAVDKSCVTSPGVYTDPKFMVTLVAGSPGCQEHISSENGPADALAVKSHTCMYCPSPPARCASHVCVVVSQTASACSPRTTRHTPRGSGCKR